MYIVVPFFLYLLKFKGGVVLKMDLLKVADKGGDNLEHSPPV